MKSIGKTPASAGIGLQLAHIAEVAATRPSTGWLEIHPENFLANPHAAVEASWPIDDLIKLHLAESAPDRFELVPARVFIEVRGARSKLYLSRLDPPEFAFRKSIWSGQSIGEAANRALDIDGAFDPGRAVAALIGASLITASNHAGMENKL